MINKLVCNLIKLHLGVKENQRFMFNNQFNYDNYYYFHNDTVYKYVASKNRVRPSTISFNFLLSDDAKRMIIKGDYV